MDEHVERTFEWSGPSSDPHDEQFGDVVEEATAETVSEFDVVLLGEPFHGAVIGRRGAREGPDAIREALTKAKTHHLELGPIERVGDLGNLTIPEGESVRAVHGFVTEVTHEIHESEAVPVFLGGDNSLTYPNLVPLLEGKRVGAINIDAHLDCRAVHEQPTSGSPYRQLLETGLSDLVVVGARDFETSSTYVDYLHDQGGTIIPARDVAADPETAALRALDALGNVESIYLSVDVDALDLTAAPGVSAPTPGGVRSLEAFELVRHITSDDRIAGFEVVETAPALCPDGRTATTAARIVAHALAGISASGTR